MPFDWREYVRLARKLAGESVTCIAEAEYRSGVSRAYYGAYCYARNQARDNLGFRPSGKPSDHRLLQEFLQGCGYSGIAAALKDLRDARNTCDYDDTPIKQPALLLLKALADAQDIIEKFAGVRDGTLS